MDICKLWGILLLSALPSLAQTGNGELYGKIHDPSGLGVPAARVQATGTATGARFTAVSDVSGDYHLLGLPWGQYSISVDKPGFKTYEHTGITLRLGTKTEMEVALEIGSATQSVNVTSVIGIDAE